MTHNLLEPKEAKFYHQTNKEFLQYYNSSNDELALMLESFDLEPDENILETWISTHGETVLDEKKGTFSVSFLPHNRYNMPSIGFKLNNSASYFRALAMLTLLILDNSPEDDRNWL